MLAQECLRGEVKSVADGDARQVREEAVAGRERSVVPAYVEQADVQVGAPVPQRLLGPKLIAPERIRRILERILETGRQRGVDTSRCVAPGRLEKVQIMLAKRVRQR